MSWFDVLIMVTAPFVLCFSAFPILERFSIFRILAYNDKFLASMIVGLATILFPLYFVGIIVGNFFTETSIILFSAGLILISTKLKACFNAFSRYIRRIKNVSSIKISLINFALLVSIQFFTLKYGFLLLVKEIIDYDVATHYLPLARAICQQNMIPLTHQGLYITGAEGSSILYAWIYAISSSLLAENFRILPLFFVLITMLLVYSITKLFLNENVAKLAVIIFVFMPILDNSLVWFSFYPDIPFTMLATSVFYFLLKYMKTRETVFYILAGFALGLSSFMKAQALWLFPVILLTFLPSIKNKILRFSVSLLTPFVFLLGVTPLSYGYDSFNEILIKLLNLFTYENFWYPFSLFFLGFLIAIINEQGVKAHVFLELNKIDLYKMIVTICSIAAPFYLIWYLRNYFALGTFLWRFSVKDANFQWAFRILESASNRGPSGVFYLASLLFPLTLPALGTAFIIPKLVGATNLIKINEETSPLYAWTIGYFMFAFAYTSVINERFLLPIVPFVAIFSAIGISFIVGYFRKSQDVDIIVLTTMFLGIFSIIQSSLIFHLSRTGSNFIFAFISKITALIGVPWSILCGQLSISEISSQTIYLLYFGLIVSFVMALLFIFARAHNLTSKVKRDLYFSLVLVVMVSVLVAPHFYLVFSLSDGKISTFRYQQRIYYGYGNLYSEILPYLSANAIKGDVILSFGTTGTGLPYYLEDIKIFDISFPDNLATLRSAVESDNVSQTFFSLQNLNVRFILVPRDVFQKTPPLISSFLDATLNSKVELLNRQLFFKLIFAGNWKLYELQSIEQISGTGPSVTVLEDNVSRSYKNEYFYWNIDNVTAVLKLSGYNNYNIKGFPAYYSYETIIPSPSEISVDANRWINFTGSANTTYTVYWSNTNWQYQNIIWKDDSFVEGWFPLWGISQPNTTGDIVSLRSPENKTWTHILKETSIALKESNYFVARITDIDGEVIFSGIVDGTQKHFTPWISLPGIYIFDILERGTNCSYMLIYLKSNTRVQIDYIMFVK